MNTYQLNKFINKDNVSKRYFLGVFARDELPIINKVPCSFIINTHKRNQPGEHWLAFHYDADKNAEFFDPIGVSADYYGLDKYLDITAKKWTQNEQRIQGFFSDYCGLYCLFFIYFKSRNFTLKQIQSFFDVKHFNKNDKKISNFFKLVY